MGREILYCTGCQTQLRETDFEKDRAFRIQNRAYCVVCAQSQLTSLSPDQMKALLRKVADPSTAPATARAVARPSSSSKTPRPPVARSGGSGLLVGFLVGAGALLVIVWLAMSSGRPQPPPPPPPAPPHVVDRPAPPPPPPPRPAEVLNLPREVAALDDQARPLLARESFKAAADVYEAARNRHPDAQWKALLDGKAAEARKEAQRLFDTLKAQAAEARKVGKMDQVKALQTRVAAWGLSDLTAALEAHLASIPEGRPWVSIFDGRNADFLNPTDLRTWQLQGGVLTQKIEKAGAAQSSGTWGDGDIRFRFEVGNASFMGLAVRQSATGMYGVMLDGAQIGALPPGPHEVIFVCRGLSVTATFDGKPVKVEMPQGPSPAGHLQFNSSDGPLRILAIDFRAPTP
ncbi:MAG TPA: hypothetical protein VF950_12610 [Planctomycetota bacterium]